MIGPSDVRSGLCKSLEEIRIAPMARLERSNESVTRRGRSGSQTRKPECPKCPSRMPRARAHGHLKCPCPCPDARARGMPKSLPQTPLQALGGS
eukprot:1193617-Prorocentrum_minimum.AAC.3